MLKFITTFKNSRKDCYNKMGVFGILFEHFGSIIEIRYSGNDLITRSSEYGSNFNYIYTSFEHEKVIRQFPELEYDQEWRTKAYKKLVDIINTYKTDDDKIKYIIKELKPHGFVAKYVMKKGFRPKAVKYGS